MLDKKAAYKKFVEPYLEKAYENAVNIGIPFFSSCCVFDDGEKTEYKNMINGAASNGVKLKDDQLTRHVNVSNGFETYLNNRKGYEDQVEIKETSFIPKTIEDIPIIEEDFFDETLEDDDFEEDDVFGDNED